jgi:hypothetical protein
MQTNVLLMSEERLMAAALPNIPTFDAAALHNRSDEVVEAMEVVRETVERVLATNYPDEHKKLRALRILSEDDDSLFCMLVDTAFVLGVVYARSKGGENG